jgi:hypothetical protein
MAPRKIIIDTDPVRMLCNLSDVRVVGLADQ